MPFVTLTSLDTSDLERDWSRACAELGRAIPAALTLALQDGEKEAKAAPYKDRSGDARRETRGFLETSAIGSALGYLECTVPYASYLEHGTPPHQIRPKAGHGFKGPLRRGQSRRDESDIGTHRSALRWQSAGGEVRFAAVVNHPGTKALNFMEKASRVTEASFEDHYDRLVSRVEAMLAR